MDKSSRLILFPRLAIATEHNQPIGLEFVPCQIFQSFEQRARPLALVQDQILKIIYLSRLK